MVRKIKEVNTREFISLHSIRSMELVEKTALFRRLSFYALSKINLGKYGSFRETWFIRSWNANLNIGSVHGLQNENLLHELPFPFPLQSKKLCWIALVSLNDEDVFKQEEMHFAHININSLLPKIYEFHYIANITSAFIIGISETKLDEAILLNFIQKLLSLTK